MGSIVGQTINRILKTFFDIWSIPILVALILGLTTASIAKAFSEETPFEFFGKFPQVKINDGYLKGIPQELYQDNKFVIWQPDLIPHPYPDLNFFFTSEILNIFRSPIGKDLCKAVEGRAVEDREFSMLPVLIGNAAELSGLIVTHCKKEKDSERPEISYAFNGARSSREVFPRAFVIYLEGRDEYPVGSWTTSLNLTVLFIGKNTDWEEVRAMIVHEFAISLDSKFGLLATSISALEKTYSTGEHADYALLPSGPRMDLLNKLSSRTWSSFFAMMRARQVEKMSEHYEDTELKSCGEDLREVYHKYGDSMWSVLGSKEYGVENPQAKIPKVGNKDALCYATGECYPLNKLIEDLEEENMNVTWLGEEISVCDFFRTPLLGLGRFSFFSRGPRPPKAGW